MGIGRILGGALTGLGTGMVATAAMADDERRGLALEKLRQENRTTELNTQADLQDRNAQRSDARSDVYGARDVQRKAIVNQAADATEFGRKKEIIGLEQNNKIAAMKVGSGLTMSENQQKASLDAAAAATRAGLEVDSSEITADGSKAFYSKSGKLISQTAAGVFLPRSSGKDDEDNTIIGKANAGRPTAPVTAPKVAPKAAAPAKVAAKTITKAQVAEAARTQGMSYADASKWAQSNGFTVK